MLTHLTVLIVWAAWGVSALIFATIAPMLPFPALLVAGGLVVFVLVLAYLFHTLSYEVK